MIGEIQVADVPGRHEPGTGEINYPAIARALDAMGYRGVIGLEAWPEGDDELALQRFRAAFSLEPRHPPSWSLPKARAFERNAAWWDFGWTG